MQIVIRTTLLCRHYSQTFWEQYAIGRYRMFQPSKTAVQQDFWPPSRWCFKVLC